MITRIMSACLLALGFFCGTVGAQTNLFQAQWSREDDRMYSKNIMNSAVIGDAQLRLWLSPTNIVHFTVIMPCLTDKRLIQVTTWKEGSELAFGESCEGRPMQTDLPKYLRNEMYPLPRTIEVIRKKPTKKIVM